MIKILFLLNLSTYIKSINFKYDLKPYGMRCMGEILGDQTLRNLKSNNTNIQVRIFDPKMESIFILGNQTEINFSFTNFDSGTHQICVDNLEGLEGVQINLEILTGIDAKDYSSLVQRNKLKPIELILTKMENIANHLVQEQIFIEKREQQIVFIYDQLKNKIYYLRFITLICLITLTFYQSFYLKKFFRQKKLL